ncbi:MerR family transcriptional regulator [Catellatospora sichuanensis]|uniref:MerR family transcriptional regulator n=1 Tax=Catellatospora sichuanensis TaxID=1969805 RepID=UPI001182921C|nr:MerR family transcriptional regulator [Catellatospora sichuanensis]
MKSSERMEIGDVAAAYGLGTHVLRHWEQMGVLTPGRTGAGHRVYGPSDVARVALILLGKKAGLSLDQIRELLGEDADRDRRLALYRQHHAELRERVVAVQASLAIVEHALECPAEDFTTCPDFQAKVAGQIPPRLRP